MHLARLTRRSMGPSNSSTFQGVLDQLSRASHARDLNPAIKTSGTRSDGIANPGLTVADGENDECITNTAESQLQGSVSHQDTEERNRELSRTIDLCLDTQNIWLNSSKDSAKLGDQSITPAQRFYLENRELLNMRAVEYRNHQLHTELARTTQEIQDEWEFYRHPVIRKPRGYSWPSSGSLDSTSSDIADDFKTSFQSGVFPTIEDLVRFLDGQSISNIKTIDLETINRRDIGEWAIIGTVTSSVHATKAAHSLRKQISLAEIENAICNISAIPGQEWIVVRIGPVILHFMTEGDRNMYALDDMYSGETMASLHNEVVESRSVVIPHARIDYHDS